MDASLVHRRQACIMTERLMHSQHLHSPALGLAEFTAHSMGTRAFTALLLLGLLAALGSVCAGSPGPADNTVIKPGVPWFDSDGNRM
jgi:hypothetical protein